MFRSVGLLASALALWGHDTGAKADPPVVGYTEQVTAATRYANENPSMIPRSLHRMAFYPIAWRRVFEARLSMAERMQLRRDHLMSFVIAPENRTAVQSLVAGGVGALPPVALQVIRSAIDSLPSVFDESRSIEDRRKIAEFVCAAAKDVMSERERELVFSTLGPEDPTLLASISVDRAKLATESIAPRNILSLASAGLRGSDRGKICGAACYECTCHRDSICQGCGNGLCLASGRTCCGCFGIWECNGAYYNIER